MLRLPSNSARLYLYSQEKSSIATTPDPASSTTPRPAVTVAIVLFVGILAMSSASLMIRWAQQLGTPSLVIAALRLTTASLVLTIPAIRQRAWKDYATLSRSALSSLLISGLLLGLHFAAWVTSLSETSVLSSVVLVTTTPLWISLASPFLLGERTSRRAWLGMLITAIGGIVIGISGIGESTGSTLFGDALALMGAIFGAGYLTIGRRVRNQLPLLSYLWLVYGTAAAVLLVWVLIAGVPLTGYPPMAYGWMLLLGLVPQLIGHSAANYAVRHLPASLVGITILGEPIGSTILAMMFLEERPRPLQIVGAILILLGIGVAIRTPTTTASDVVEILPEQ